MDSYDRKNTSSHKRSRVTHADVPSCSEADAPDLAQHANDNTQLTPAVEALHKDAHQQHNGRSPAPKDPTHRSALAPPTPEAKQSMSMLTWNVMGFTTVVDELQDIIREHEPDLIVLTETKSVNEQHGSYNIQQPFSGLYKIFCTSVSMPANKGKQIQNRDDRPNLHERSGAGGVLLAVHNRWQPDAFVRVHAHDKVPYLISHVLGISISLPSGLQLDVFGIYMPAKGTVRQMIYNHLKKQANGPHTIMLGDWNADPH